MGAGSVIKYGTEKPKNIIYKYLDSTFELLNDIQLMNFDFKKCFESIQFREINQTFIYSDPPYLQTDDNDSNSFKESDSFELFEALQKTGCKFAYSEFNNPFILQQAKERNLNVHIIGERQNLKNRRTEILITNYENNQLKLF
jgi:DNA adenine methylase